jgi:hypothetical protein
LARSGRDVNRVSAVLFRLLSTSAVQLARETLEWKRKEAEQKQAELEAAAELARQPQRLAEEARRKKQAERRLQRINGS